jgi:hypothetical protein
MAVSITKAGKVRDSLELLPLLAQELLPLAHRREKPGVDVLSPHLQIQASVKMTYQEILALLLSYPHLAEQVTLFPSIKLYYLTSSTRFAWILPLGTQGPRSSENKDC